MLDLALKKLTHNRYISAMTSFAIALSFLIFLLLSSVLERYAERITARTEGDFLVVGNKGTNVDLIMDSLYFRQEAPNFISQGSLEPTRKVSQLAALFNVYSIQENPLIGNDVEYFDIRQLTFSQGGPFTQMGECVVGSAVASKLKLSVNDTLISDPKNIFDPGGSTPIKLTICGILNKSDSPDDNVIFTSLKTAWTAHGIGHSHAPEVEGPDLGVKIIEFTPETLKTFHFHGEEKDFPVTSALVLPKSAKEATMIIAEAAAQRDIHIIRPKLGLQSFLNMIFQMNHLFSVILALVIILLIIFFSMLLYLQVKLRQKEKDLLKRIGAENTFFLRLICAEWSILTLFGLAFGFISSIILNPILLELFDKITKG